MPSPNRNRNRLTAVVQPGSPAPIVLVSVEGGDDGDAVEAPPLAADASAAAAASAAVLRRAGASACAALSLGVLGSTVFPIPFAVSRTGLLSAALTMAAVAWANDQTSGWLISAAAATGHSSYEALALWAGGVKMKRLTQFSLIALLWGTMVAGLCLIADTGRMALRHCLFKGGGGGGSGNDAAAVAKAAATAAAASGGGRLVMLAVSALVLFPLCLQRRMRELEAAGAAGGLLVLGLVALLFWRAGRSGWQGLADVPIWSLAPGDPARLPEAFAIYFTAFYMQPMLLPLVRDMPGVEGGGGAEEEEEEQEQEEAATGRAANGGGNSSSSSPPPPPLAAARAKRNASPPHAQVTAAQGLAALRAAVRITLYGVACGVYLGVGVAGAGAFGAGTHGNVLTNDVLDEGWGEDGKDGGRGARGAAAAAAGGVFGGGLSSSSSGRPLHPHHPPHPPVPPPSHPKRGAAALLYALVLLYLALGMTTTQFALRSSLDIALFGAAGDDVGADAPATPPPPRSSSTRRRRRRSGGDDGDEEEDDEEDPPVSGDQDDDDDDDANSSASSLPPPSSSSSPPPPRPLRPGFTWPRHVLLTAGSIASAAFVACLVPRAAEKVYAVVGATGVCAVSYVIPAFLKVQLYREKKGLVRRGGGEEASGRHHHQHHHHRGHVVARRAPRPGSGGGLGARSGGSGSALALPLLLDPSWPGGGGGGGEGAQAGVGGGGGGFAASPGSGGAPMAPPALAQGYIFAAAAAAGAAAAPVADDELGLASALLTPPPPQPSLPPPQQPARVAVVRRPALAAVQHRKRLRPHPRPRWRLLPAFEDAPPGPERRALVAEAAREVLLPVAVALFGVLSSAAALAVAVQSAFFGDGHGGGGGGDGGGAAALLGRFVEAHVL